MLVELLDCGSAIHFSCFLCHSFSFFVERVVMVCNDLEIDPTEACLFSPTSLPPSILPSFPPWESTSGAIELCDILTVLMKEIPFCTYSHPKFRTIKRAHQARRCSACSKNPARKSISRPHSPGFLSPRSYGWCISRVMANILNILISMMLYLTLWVEIFAKKCRLVVHTS